jgi:carbonic anhydrase
MEIEQIFKNNRKWICAKLAEDSNYFEKLSAGQSPQVLYIGCSDSRVTAEELMGAKPGEMFIHRNIANMVPGNDLNVLSVIHYAVHHLKVKHIVVCGHYYCGGIEAALLPSNLGILNPWLQNIRDVYRSHQAELDKLTDPEHKYRRLVELNVQEQCLNVLKIADVQKSVRAHELTVHGWVFDIHSGKLKDLRINFEKLVGRLRGIYAIR